MGETESQNLSNDTTL